MHAAPRTGEAEQVASFTAMVLAGGLGTRLRPVVADRPKALAPTEGEPFLVHVLDQLARAGCDRVILCTGHLGDQIEREFGDEHAGMDLVWSREPSPLGTAGALRHALCHLHEDAALVVNGDSYCDLDLAAFVAWARGRHGLPALVAAEVPDTRRFGSLQLAADGSVLAFREKDPAGGAGNVNAGIYWLPRAVFANLPAGIVRSLERDVLPPLVGQGLAAFRTKAPFLDIGTPESYAQCEAFFAGCAAARRRDRKGLLVVDRDGTLIVERHHLADPAGVELLPGVVDGLRAFAERGFEIAIVTNQSGIGRGYFDEATLASVHVELRRQLTAAGIEIRGIWHCPHHPEHGCRCRKPEPELLERAMQQLGYEPDQCLVVGDKVCDIELGSRLGVRTALVRTGYGTGTERDGLCAPDLVVDSLAQLALLEARS